MVGLVIMSQVKKFEHFGHYLAERRYPCSSCLNYPPEKKCMIVETQLIGRPKPKIRMPRFIYAPLLNISKLLSHVLFNWNNDMIESMSLLKRIRNNWI